MNRTTSLTFLLGALTTSALLAKTTRGEETAPAQEHDVPEPTVAPDTPPAIPDAPLDVIVRGSLTERQRLQRSGEAVTVVDTHQAKQRTADLGEVMARTQGVSLQRSSGLGSDTRFSLNGLHDDQIRFFLDGVPLEAAGYPFGVANVPVNLIDRIEVYRGVVPIRFGADALGGAVNLVSDPRYTTGASASYEVGSFGTYRWTLGARYLDESSGFVASASGFLDTVKNDYRVDVDVTDAQGSLRPASVPRFHDAYLARGGAIEVGYIDRPWAKRLLLRGFYTGYDKELQNNPVMTVPYGEAAYGENVAGGTLRYEEPLAKSVDLDVVANYSQRTIDFVDKSIWIYDWFGRRIGQRRIPGEIQNEPTDQTFSEQSGFGRVNLSWAIAPFSVVRASATPTYTTRTGKDRIRADLAERDPLSARRHLLTFVTGIEQELDAFPTANAPAKSEERRRDTDYRLQNFVFAKHYVYDANTEESQPGDVFQPLHKQTQQFGFGDSLRFFATDWLLAKASYEYAARLPRPDEVFGDGVLIHQNLDLQPEVSKNANVGPRIELRHTSIGELTVDVNGFLRDSNRLIVLLGNDRELSYQNIYRAVSKGVEGSLSWTSPGHHLTLDGSSTWQDLRNASGRGAFGQFEGDRIPNRPWLFASWGALLRFADLLDPSDTLEPFYVGRYVHDFYRGWESLGVRASKQVVAAQVTHGVGVTYSLRTRVARVSSTLEVQNLTDAKVYDFFGAERPGRGIFLKMMGDI